MQSVYALSQSKSDNLTKEEKFLKKSIADMQDLHALLISLLVEVQKKAQDHLEIDKKKYLASAEEQSPKIKFIGNKVFEKLNSSNSLLDYLEKRKLNNWSLDDEFVRIIWDLIQESELFTDYIKIEEPTFNQDKDFVVGIFKEIVAPNEKLADYFESNSITWVDDIPFVNTWIVKDLKNLKPNRPFKLGKLYKDEEDEKFVLDLFRKVVLKAGEFEDDINKKTPNWDSDRIAEIDLILIKMALSEFVHFPSIPTSVSINEYIEIAKDYSSQKSSFFVNGVLAKILKEYKTADKINKIGRGLM